MSPDMRHGSSRHWYPALSIALCVASCCGRDHPSPAPSPLPSLSASSPGTSSPPLGRDAAVAAIRSSPFAASLPALDKALLPVVRIDARAADPADIPVGASHFGGLPDVPPGFAWPRFKSIPLGLLAQVRMQDVPEQARDGLPASGWLLFFYEMQAGTWGFDPKDRDSFRVVYVDSPAADLVRTQPPPELPEASRALRWSALSFAAGVSLPDPSDSAFDALGVNLDADEAEQQYRALADRIAGQGPSDSYHHLLGYPQVIQNDMRIEAQLASHGVYVGGPRGYEGAQAGALEAGKADWVLLLQLDTDESGPGWMWGDSGTLFFWIRKQDLAARNFGAAWMILQCY